MNTQLIASFGPIRVEAKETHVSGIHDNFWAQVVGPEGVYARFGKPVPATSPAAVARAAAVHQAIEYAKRTANHCAVPDGRCQSAKQCQENGHCDPASIRK